MTVSTHCLPKSLVGYVAAMAAVSALCTIGLPHIGRAQTQQDMNQGSDAAYQNANKKLDATYQQVLKTETPSSAKRLKAAETAWSKFRQLQATFESDFQGNGSIAPLIGSEAMTATTNLRLDNFKSLGAGHVRGESAKDLKAQYLSANKSLRTICAGLGQDHIDSDTQVNLGKDFRAAETAWEQFRDLETAYEAGRSHSSPTSGTGYAVGYYLTTQRVHYLTAAGWDMSKGG
jgi:uncharacterized protein YecT (DUF1311 family)